MKVVVGRQGEEEGEEEESLYCGKIVDICFVGGAHFVACSTTERERGVKRFRPSGLGIIITFLLLDLF